MHEMSTFPKGKYDDQVDATSQALDWFSKRLGLGGWAAEMARQWKAAQQPKPFTQKCPKCGTPNPSRYGDGYWKCNPCEIDGRAP